MPREAAWRTSEGGGEALVPRALERQELSALFAAVYAELKSLAQSQRRRWEGDYTLNTTALVHEAYVKLAGAGAVRVENRAHFLALAGRAMRQILVNYAERRRAQKRDASGAVDPDDGANPLSAAVAEEILELHGALERLARVEERHARVVECRFFAGLQIDETAVALGVSPATVKRDWQFASAWLRRELGGVPPERRAMG
jgi:RNA polymerase sigma-70 factor, ECF subfamily